MEDAYNDYSWRVDSELTRLDASTPLASSFEEYLAGYTREFRHSPNQRYYFAIETTEGRHIGNCLCYGVDKYKKQAELGIMIGDRDYWDKGYGTDAITTMVSHIFRQTDLKRIYLKTLNSNGRAQRCFKKCGFNPFGHLSSDGYSFVLMELYHEQWQLQNKEGN